MLWLRVLAAMVAMRAPGASLYSLTEVPEGSPPACADRASLLCSAPRWHPGRQAWVRPETRAEGLRRYRVIAEELAAVVCAADPMCLMRSPAGEQLDEAARIVATTYHESGWAESIHAGHWRGDGGRSSCLGQILTVGPERMVSWHAVAPPWTAADLEGTGREPTRRCLVLTALALERAGVVRYTGADTAAARRRLGTVARARALLERAEIGADDREALGIEQRPQGGS